MSQDIFAQDAAQEAAVSGLLEQALFQYAPDAAAQQRLAAYFAGLREDYPQDARRRNMHMAGAVTDGLRHGNWPWTQREATGLRSFQCQRPGCGHAAYRHRESAEWRRLNPRRKQAPGCTGDGCRCTGWVGVEA